MLGKRLTSSLECSYRIPLHHLNAVTYLDTAGLNRTSSKRHENLQSDDFRYDHTYDPSYMKNLFITSRVKNVNHNPQYRSDIRNIVDHQAQQCQALF
jgi:hypothetical protein